MRFQFILCRLIQREAYLCAARSPHVVDLVLMPQGLHLEPDKLRASVQGALNVVEDSKGRPYDASLLGYGLCSNGIVGLQARIKTVVPRGHDCVTLLLGSKEKYQQYFDSHRGVYWYSSGWIEHSLQPGRERCEQILKEYVQKYGEDNAQYLMEMEQKWMKEYQWATYIDWGFPNSEREKGFTRECAEFLKWNYDELPGDQGLLQRLVNGGWDDESFLVLEPGRKIEADVTRPGIVKAV
jgi:hypothetical protein